MTSVYSQAEQEQDQEHGDRQRSAMVYGSIQREKPNPPSESEIFKRSLRLTMTIQGNELITALRQCRILCCPFGWNHAGFITALIVIAALLLFVADIVIIGAKYGHSKDLVVRNDYVLLEANPNGLYSAAITFNITNFTSDSIGPNMITYIYQVPCYEVHKLNESQIERQSLRVAFNACGIYNNKCVLDEYWYCSKSKAALMFYAFNFTFVNQREELKIAVFDDALNYMSYLSGKESLEGALYTRDVPTNTSYWEFDFTSARMRKEVSYYFFVIVDLKGGTEPFLVTKNEIRTYFNLSMILPNCKVMNNESCSSNIGLTMYDSCFLAQAQGQYNSSSYGSKDMVYVTYKLKYFSWSILSIASLLLCGAPIITYFGLYFLKSICSFCCQCCDNKF